MLKNKLLPILTYPDPILALKASPVTIFDNKLLNLTNDMLYTMYQSPGIGLAAPQIGISEQIFVLDVTYTREKVTSNGITRYLLDNFNPMTFINPKILKTSTEMVETEEGCLSLPEINEKVSRHKSIKLKYQTVTGETQTLEADELLAICIQHEIDHLNGKVFLDRLTFFKKNILRKQLIKRSHAKT